jgi:lipopolysaccharide/colanic/teichoic acid biosynthesis glycosyltransferase
MSSGIRIKQAALIAGDIIVLYAALAITLIARYGMPVPQKTLAEHVSPFSALFFLWLLIFYITNLYDARRLKNTADFFRRIGAGVLVSGTISIFFFYTFTDYGIAPKTNLFIFIAIAFTGLSAWRAFANRFIARQAPLVKTAIVGSGAVTDELRRAIEENPQLGYAIAPWREADLIVVAKSLQEKPGAIAELYRAAAEGAETVEAAAFYERIFGKLPIAELHDAWFLAASAHPSRSYALARRPAEVVGALVLATLLSPVMLAIAIAIRLTSKGPVIFKQERTGAFGKPFMLYKFRSMIANAADGSAEGASGPQWKSKNDSRFTPVGRFLERTHLDELPQLWNILNGDLSFVGPRPERPVFVEQLSRQIPYYELRHIVRPGIAGWAQLNYPYGASVEDAYHKLTYDLYYIKHRSFWIDAGIIIKTLKLFFVRPA